LNIYYGIGPLLIAAWTEIHVGKLQMETSSSMSDGGHPRGEKHYTRIDYTITKLITWSSALLEKPPFVELLKNFPVFYET
jgi:hypothetical protein